MPHGVPAALPRRRDGDAVRSLRQLRGRLVPDATIADDARLLAPPARSTASACRSSRGAQWPTGADRLGVPGRRAASHRPSRPDEGRALARLTDLGWGGTLRELFAAGAPDAPVPPQVLAACVRVLADWGWAERPVAVVAMPSRSRPQLVDSLARGIAEVGRLPYLGAPRSRSDGGPTGEPGGNSAFRLAGRVGPVQRRRASTCRPAACCSSTTRPTAAGPSRSPRARCARRGATAVLPFVLALRG